MKERTIWKCKIQRKRGREKIVAQSKSKRTKERNGNVSKKRKEETQSTKSKRKWTEAETERIWTGFGRWKCLQGGYFRRRNSRFRRTRRLKQIGARTAKEEREREKGTKWRRVLGERCLFVCVCVCRCVLFKNVRAKSKTSRPRKRKDTVCPI